MNRRLLKTVCCGGLLLLYLFVLVTLWGWRDGQEASVAARIAGTVFSTFFAEADSASVLKSLHPSEAVTGILLPLGPGDGVLPGDPAVWEEIPPEGHLDPAQANAGGFEGLQVAASSTVFSSGAVAEVFLSGSPLRAFRRGQMIILLNDLGEVHAVDCENPRSPKLLPPLPYRSVTQIEMRDAIAYLLIVDHHGASQKIVVVDLENLYKPREIARISLSGDASAFALSGSQLAVYSNTGGYQGKVFLELFDISDDFQLRSVGRVESPILDKWNLQYGDYLVAAGDRSGLRLYDFSNPLQPLLSAEILVSDQIKRLCIYGDRLFAYGIKGRLYVVSLADPENPVLLKTLGNANHAAFLLGVNGYSYYFTLNGYLEVFDLSFREKALNPESLPVAFDGEAASLQNKSGLTFLTESKGRSPAGSATLPWRDEAKIIDTLTWKGLLVILDGAGELHFRKVPDALVEDGVVLKLSASQRWLAASGERLFVGGESTIDIVAQSDVGNIALVGQVDLAGQESWDGLVLQKTLYLAMGKNGLLSIPLQDIAQSRVENGWTLPPQLESQVNARQLASSGNNRLFVAAGPPGLLSGLVDQSGQLRFNGSIDFPEPAHAVAVVGDTCLVSTGSEVFVVDVRQEDSLQKLGAISLLGVERFAVGDNDYWAGYVPPLGWYMLPSPQFVFSEEGEGLMSAAKETLEHLPPHDYRLNLFDDGDVFPVQGLLSTSVPSAKPDAGAVHERL